MTPQPSTENLPTTPCPSPFDMGYRSGIENGQAAILVLEAALIEISNQVRSRYDGDGMSDEEVASIADAAVKNSADLRKSAST